MKVVRKKSGELVKPALRSPLPKSSTIPGLSKIVHFDPDLEHICFYRAVSPGSSPAENFDSGTTEYSVDKEKSTIQYEWEIVLSNFPVETAARKSQAVRLERVWLSSDQNCLTGSVVVANLAFQKAVTCRFTVDCWETFSEVAAEYVAETQLAEKHQEHDHFQFIITLSELACHEAKTLYFCVRYRVNGRDLWDNNDGTNFRINFKKKNRAQNDKGVPQEPPTNRPSASLSGQPFANRYDFGASLIPANAVKSPFTSNTTAPTNNASSPAYVICRPPVTISSATYEELLNKYCFVRTSRDKPL